METGIKSFTQRDKGVIAVGSIYRVWVEGGRGRDMYLCGSDTKHPIACQGLVEALKNPITITL